METIIGTSGLAKECETKHTGLTKGRALLANNYYEE